MAIAASKAGQPNHPARYHDLLAHPDATIRLRGEVRAVRARIATAEEYPQLWRSFVATTPDFEFYRERAGRRVIPVVVLEPR